MTNLLTEQEQRAAIEGVVLLLHIGRPQQALVDMSNALVQTPQDSKYWFPMAKAVNLLDTLGLPKWALNELEEALEHQPKEQIV
jgi:hypothetical protein